jgi:hypothetical protein
MIILSETDHSLEVVLAGAVATTQLPVTVAWADLPAFESAAGTTATNSTTPVTIVAAPAADVQRQIKGVKINNVDTAPATVIVSLNDASTLRRQLRVTLAVNESLEYGGERWQVMTADGSIKGVGTPGTNGTPGASGHLLTGVNVQTGTSYTLVLGDAGGLVNCANAGAFTLTVPPNSSVAFPVGQVIYVKQGGAGQVTIDDGSGVTLQKEASATLATLEQHSWVALTQIATDVWDVVGGLEPA